MKRTTFFLLFIGLVQTAFAQNGTPQDDNQFWADAQLTTAIKENINLSFTGAGRIGDDFGRMVYERVGTGVTVILLKGLSAGTSYSHVATQPRTGGTLHENRLSTDGNFQVPLHGGTISNRHAVEFRFRDGVSSRYRTRLQYEHPATIGSHGFRVFAWDEVTYDGAVDGWSRMRVAAGGTRALGHNTSIDIYYLHQFGLHDSANDLNVIGTSLKFTLR